MSAGIYSVSDCHEIQRILLFFSALFVVVVLIFFISETNMKGYGSLNLLRKLEK